MTDLLLYGPQVAAVATGLVAALTRVPRDLPRPFGVVTALLGVAALVFMKRWVAADCIGDSECHASGFEESVAWIGWGFSAILALTIIAASTADVARFLRHRRSSSEGG